MEGFVDDTTGWTNTFLESLQHGSLVEKITGQLQVLAQWWEELLTTTGGKLELPKCFYYIVHFDFSSDGLPTLRTFSEDDDATKLTVRDSVTGEIVSVQHYSTKKAHRTLGVMLCPDLSHDAEVTHLHSKIQSLCTRLLPHRLNQSLIRRFLLTMCRPCFSYSAPISTIPEHSWKLLQQRLTSIVLNKLHFSTSTPSAILHAPLASGGLDLPDGYAEQGSQHVLHLMKHVRSNNTVGDHLLTVLRWTHLYSGYIDHPLSRSALPMPHVFSPWVETTRQYLLETDCSLDISSLPPHNLHRIHDKSIMELALKRHGDSAVLTLRRINACRLYLQVTLLSDICTRDGRKIQAEVLSTSNPTTNSTSTLRWPYQPKPSAISWRLFHALLRSLCIPGTNYLVKPLGHWSSQDPHRKWNAYFDSENQQIWHWFSNSWNTSQAKAHRTKVSSTITTTQSTLQPPLTAVPVTRLMRMANSIHWSFSTRRTPKIPRVQLPQVGPVALQPWEHQLLSQLEVHMPLSHLREHLLSSRERDGGAREHLITGSFGWPLQPTRTPWSHAVDPLLVIQSPLIAVRQWAD